MAVDFSFETMEASWEWPSIFKVLQEKNCQPRNIHAEKMPLNKDEIKMFSAEGKLRKSTANRTALREFLKENL